MLIYADKVNNDRQPVLWLSEI